MVIRNIKKIIRHFYQKRFFYITVAAITIEDSPESPNGKYNLKNLLSFLSTILCFKILFF